MIRWFESQQVYVPLSVIDVHPAAVGLKAEDVYFKARDGVRLNGWFFPSDKASPRSHLVFLHLHGNAGNISHRHGFYQAWLELGVNVFAFDYRGYGRSQGRPDEEGTYLDAQAAHRWLRERGFAAGHIIALGKSLGGGVAAELALREPLGGLILQNTFTSIPDLGAEWFPWLPVRQWCSILYDTRSKLPRIRAPVLVAHSRGDMMVQYHHAEKNFAAAHRPKLLWEIYGSHNETLEAGRARYLEGLETFLGAHFPLLA